MMAGISGERRVRNVMVGDAPLDPGKTYTISGSNYLLLEGGDGFTAFDDSRVICEIVDIDSNLLMQYISEDLDGTVGDGYTDPYGDGRIVIVEKAPE